MDFDRPPNSRRSRELPEGPTGTGGAAGATVNKELACLSSILSDYGLWAQVRRDVKRLDENEEAGRALNREEKEALRESASHLGKHRQGHWSPDSSGA